MEVGVWRVGFPLWGDGHTYSKLRDGQGQRRPSWGWTICLKNK